MRRKVKEKLEPLALATVRDSIRKVRAMIASGPEYELLRTKKVVLLNSHAILIITPATAVSCYREKIDNCGQLKDKLLRAMKSCD